MRALLIRQAGLVLLLCILVCALSPVGAASSTAQPSGGPVIDILIAYTPRARTEVGGTAQIERLIRLAVSETNVVYANSAVHQRMRLVGIAEAPYDETRVIDLLGALRDPDDGIMDELHALRDRYGADLVSMVTDGSEGNGFGCGVGYVTRATPADAARAFTLVRASCLVNYWTLAHETGHNMGF